METKYRITSDGVKFRIERETVIKRFLRPSIHQWNPYGDLGFDTFVKAEETIKSFATPLIVPKRILSWNVVSPNYKIVDGELFVKTYKY